MRLGGRKIRPTDWIQQRNNKGAHKQPKETKEPPKVTLGEPNLLPSIDRFNSFSPSVKATDLVGW